MYDVIRKMAPYMWTLFRYWWCYSGCSSLNLLPNDKSLFKIFSAFILTTGQFRGQFHSIFCEQFGGHFVGNFMGNLLDIFVDNFEGNSVGNFSDNIMNNFIEKRSGTSRIDVECLYLMIWLLSRFLGRNLSIYLLLFLENSIHQYILKWTPPRFFENLECT